MASMVGNLNPNGNHFMEISTLYDLRPNFLSGSRIFLAEDPWRDLVEVSPQLWP
jgi:hypothetical protein